MAKFMQTTLSIKRLPPIPVIEQLSEECSVLVKTEEERLTLIIEYVGIGDTTKLTTEELMAEVQNLLGTELK